MTRVTATEAARTFSSLLNRVQLRGEEFVVVRGGQVVCRMSRAGPPRHFTVRQLIDVLADAPAPDPGLRTAVRQAVRRQGQVPTGRWGR